ncbi:basic secretory family protein [Dactylosporangium fulvum]|uniref:Basic secretory family protein n=1 Tax=Dactylosporangium fulvum TaxID=53359 RepID=A0ABY5W354_9ACTN|nr:basic secretory family protein [Dactylosporangium fulvum]UWP83489.1 basic secretory family protein [Dactylosporangium fulvum]
MHYQQPYPPYPPPVPPKRVNVLRVALLVALAVLLLAPAGAIAFEATRQDRTATLAGQGLGTAGDRPVGESNGGGAKGGSGETKGAPPTTVDGKVRRALSDQGAALVGGDQAAFLAPVDQTATKLRDDLARRFGSLRQLQVKVWEPTVVDKVKVVGDGTATAKVYVRYCFVVETCDPMNFQTATRWNVSGKTVTLLEFGVSDDLGPRPWEASELRTAVGQRVVLSTTPKYASRLPSMLASAEKAAALTDRYAKWGPPPSRYTVYLAGPDEWSSWYGIKQENWVAGFALPLTPNATEIVLNAARVDAKETLDVLRHEFTHVVTLAGVDRAYDKTWWLVEGLAEYVRVKGEGKPFSQMSDVRAYVRSGHWKNEIAMDDPPEGASTSDVSGRYGIAYLSVQRLADRFGEEKMLDFFDLTTRQGMSLTDAAPKALGMSWDDVANDCVRNVKART